MRNLVFKWYFLLEREGAALGLVIQISNDSVAEALVAARQIAGRGPDDKHGAKTLINRLSNARLRRSLRRRKRDHLQADRLNQLGGSNVRELREPGVEIH
jgi:hypothetical protein